MAARIVSLLALITMVATILGAPARAVAQSIDYGVWSGVLTLPTRASLEFSIEIGERPNGELWGTITIPSQGTVNQPLDEVSIGDREIRFTWGAVNAVFSGRLGANGTSIIGTLEQAGSNYPFRLDREAPRQKFEGEIVREEQRWRGVAKLPGLDLEFMVTFKPSPAEQGWSAEIDIPLQNIAGMPLKSVRFDEEIHFTIQLDTAAAPPPAVFALERTGAESAEGTFTQAGSTFVVTLSRITDPNETVELPRPQTPKPPFPYSEREVTYTSPVDGVTLAGTLTIPEGDGPHPAVLMLTGSGPQDRDETIMGHKPFWVIADHLSRRGIAVLRVDDRGVGGSGGDTMQTTAATNVQDAIAGVEFLKRQPEVNGAKVGLIGHSEGAWIAPIAASKSDEIAYIVLLAAPGVSGKELVLMQRDAVRATVGVPPDVRQKEREAHEALLNAIERGAPEADIADALRELARLERGDAADAEEYANRITEQQLPMMTSAWFRDVLSLDSRPALRTLEIPALVITGELDLQVPVDENMREIRGAFDTAGNTKAKLVSMPGLNHLLQRARQGLPGEYLMIQQTISPDVLTLMTEWIQQRTGVASSAD